MQQRFHSFDRVVCYWCNGVKQQEQVLTPARVEFVTERLKQKGIQWWIERKYYSL